MAEGAAVVSNPVGKGLHTDKSDHQLVTEDYLATASSSDENIPRGDGDRLPNSIRELPTRITVGQWVTVFILFYVNLINYMDRFTLAGILQDIQKQFEISNSSAGLLQTVFVISYMIFAPVFGYLGDRYSRRMIMAGGVFLWSLTTLLGSFMENNFTWFILCRAMVGIGEASYSTIAPTIISDMFLHDRRSKMLALFYFAIPVGSGMGYIVGSETSRIAGQWQWALRVTPILGAVAVLLILFFMIDPPRGESDGAILKATSWTEDIKDLAKNRSFMLSSLGFTCVSFVAGALAWWGPTFIHLGLNLQEGGEKTSMEDVSFKFGVITMLSGIIGVPLGSIAAQKLRVKNPRADPLICAFGLLVSTPLVYVGALLAMYHTTACFTLVFFGELFLNLNWSIVADILLYVVIPTRRSTAEAGQILLSHALGDAGSPYLIGVVSDALKRVLSHPSSSDEFDVGAGTFNNGTEYDPMNVTSSSLDFSEDAHNSTANLIEFRSLQYSLFITSFVEILGGLFFLMTAWYIVSDKRKCDDVINSSSAGLMIEERSSSASSQDDEEDDEQEQHVPLTQG